jgi:gamma-polyglutamate synthase
MNLFHPVNYVFLVTAASVCAFFSIEAMRLFLHQRRLHRIPVRIHVNGSRGKSSVTRLIGAVMRATGKITVTKTTGTAARFILPDGYEVPIFRPGRANIIEQIKVVKKACELNAEVLIAECMAVTPEYIGILQAKTIQGTLGVMTNVRDDHLDVMGPTVYDAAVNMSKSLPCGGHTITAERKWFGVLEQEAARRLSTIALADGEGVTDEEMDGFDYIEHKDNIAIALEVARLFHLPREAALKAMYAANPDPGVLREIAVQGPAGKVHFFNALAANDPESSQVIWNLARKRRAGLGVIIMILRDDRQQRTESFFSYLGKTMKADRYIIAGSQTAALANHLKKAGVPPDHVIALRNASEEAVTQILMDMACGDLVACAMGNIIGLGERVVESLRQLSLARREAA